MLDANPGARHQISASALCSAVTRCVRTLWLLLLGLPQVPQTGRTVRHGAGARAARSLAATTPSRQQRLLRRRGGRLQRRRLRLAAVRRLQQAVQLRVRLRELPARRLGTCSQRN